MMTNLFNPEVKFTQKTIADLLGLSDDRQVRNLMNKGVLPAAPGKNGMDPHRCVLSYIAYKAQAQNKPETLAEANEILDYEQERALNVREQRRARRIQNEMALKTLIPTEVCIKIYTELVSSARAKILAIESKAATDIPCLNIAELRMLRTLLLNALTDLSNESLPASLTDYLESCDFDLDAAAESDD